MPENHSFPEDLIALVQLRIKTFNQGVRNPSRELAHELFRLNRLIDRHPHWWTIGWTRATRAALHRAAITAPGGEEELRQCVVNGRIVIIDGDPPG
ncbi:hypothetical protein ACWCQL_30925 [Streptomyces sp. NPDC002073]